MMWISSRYRLRAGRVVRQGPAMLALAVVLITGNRVPAQESSISRLFGPRTESAAPDTDTDTGTPEIGSDQAISVHLDLARVYEVQGQFEAAVNEYRLAVDAASPKRRRPGGARPSAPMQALAHRRMASALDRLGQYAMSEVHYREALQLSPRDPRVWNDAGYSAYLQRHFDEAEMRLKTAARLAPGDARVQTNLGLCLAAMGREDEALAALTRAAGPAVAHANLGYILAASSRVDAARTHYARALDLQPDLAQACDALAALEDASSVPATTPLPAVASETPLDPTVTRTATSRESATPAVEPDVPAKRRLWSFGRRQP